MAKPRLKFLPSFFQKAGKSRLSTGFPQGFARCGKGSGKCVIKNAGSIDFIDFSQLFKNSF
jgi:hypothetical protein